MNTSNSYIPFHIYLFIFGAFYYWILPLVILKCNLLEGMPGVQLLDEYNFQHVESIYLLIIFLLVISFIIGSVLPLRFRKIKPVNKVSTTLISPRDIFLLSLPFFIYGQYIVFNARGFLFKGYTAAHGEDTMGPIATINTIFLVLYLYLKYIKSDNIWRKRAIQLCKLSLIEFSVVLLGLGSRMYVLIPIIALMVSYLRYNKLNSRLIFTVLIVAFIFLTIGIWRISSEGMNWTLLLYIGGAEPLFTWISAISYFLSNDIQMFAFPQNFITSFFNFIPRFLFPSKGLYIQPINGNYDSPLGATNLITSLLADFGLIGACLALFLLGFILTHILYNWRNIYGQVYYCCVCGILPFQFFRDAIPIVNKMALFNMLIIPLFLFVFIRITIKYNTREKSTIR
ncbi:MAG: oligosaccharide repeat unit polymerase [Bacteroidales bacterium]|nr:oligosaccharide repeat unit polymerase [Bacteroidales bacterium]MBD5242446.1 oligosaccharide repeat unit polymerase [Barnesiella sp.]